MRRVITLVAREADFILSTLVGQLVEGKKYKRPRVKPQRTYTRPAYAPKRYMPPQVIVVRVKG